MTVARNIEEINGKKERTFERFHKIMINGLLWVFPVMLVLTGIRNLDYGYQDSIPGYFLVIITAIILFASAILLIKARFDLKKMKKSGVKELLIAGIAVAVAFFIDWRIDCEFGSMLEHKFTYPLLAAFWSIAIYRYYMLFSDKLTD